MRSIFLGIFIISIAFISIISNRITYAHTGDHVIEMTDTGFMPADITIDQGEEVEFENVSKSDKWPASNIHPTHEVYPDFDPRGPVQPGYSWSFTFKDAGIYKYHDHLNADDIGTITVHATTASASVTQPVTTVNTENKSEPNAIVAFFASVKNWIVNVLGMGKKKLPADSPGIFSDEKLLSEYVGDYGPADTIKRLHEYSSQFGDCHQPAHAAGRFSYEQYGADAFRKCSAECHSGCYHGATEAYFKEHGVQDIDKKLPLICSSDLNPFFSHQCIHGVGHGLMAWANYEIHEALKYCDTLKTGLDSCYTGVFMENIVGGLAKEATGQERAELAGHFTRYLSDDPRMPCTVVAEKYRNSCYFYQTSRMLQVYGNDFSKVAAECASIEPQYRESCFASMGRDVGGASAQDPQKAIAYCAYAPPGRHREICLGGAVQNAFWDPSGEQEALNFCSLLSIPGEQKTCYDTIIGRARDVLDASRLQTFCSSIPSLYRLNCGK